MRLLVLVVGCVIVIHGSSSVPGSRQKEANAPPALQVISLEDEDGIGSNGSVGDNQAKEVTNISFQNIIQDSKDGPVKKEARIGNYNSNFIKNNFNFNENSNDNTDYSILSSETGNNGGTEDISNSGSGITDGVQSRRKREVAEPYKKVKTYKFVSQPRISRFSYIQKIQKLFSPRQMITPKIINRHKTIVVENHAAHVEHNSEETHEHNSTTTSHLKILKKKRKSKRRKPGSIGTPGREDNYQDEESSEEENDENNGHTLGNNSIQLRDAESISKTNKLNNAGVVNTDASSLTIRNDNHKNTLEKKENKIVLDNRLVSRKSTKLSEKEINASENENKSRNRQFLGGSKVKNENEIGISRPSNSDLILNEKIKTKNSATSLKTQTNSLRLNTPNENLPYSSTLRTPYYQQSTRQHIPTDERSLLSVLSGLFGIRGNNSPEQKTATLENSRSVFREALQVRNISNFLSNLLYNKEANNDATIHNRKTKESNKGEKLTTFANKKVSAPSESSRTKKKKFRITKNEPGAVSNTISEEENTRMNDNFEIGNSETSIDVSEVQKNVPSVTNLQNIVSNVLSVQEATTVKDQVNVPLLGTSGIRETGLGGVNVGHIGQESNPIVSLRPGIITNQANLASSEPSSTKTNLASVSNEPNESKFTLSVLRPSTATENKSEITTSPSSNKKIPKFRKPKGGIIEKSHKSLSYNNAVDSERQNIGHNTEIDTGRTVVKNSEMTGSSLSPKTVPVVSSTTHTFPKFRKTKQTSSTGPFWQPSMTWIPKFKKLKSKLLSTSKETLYDKQINDSEEENTQLNNNVEVENSRTIFKIPKTQGNLFVPNIEKSTTRGTSEERGPKIRRPKTVSTPQEVLYDTKGNDSENEFREINHNIEIANGQTVLNSQNTIGNPPLIRNVPDKSLYNPNVPNIPTAVRNSKTSSSKPSKERVPKFRKPKSKTTTLWNGINDNSVSDAEKDNAVENYNKDSSNSGTVLNIPITERNLPLYSTIPDTTSNLPNIPKSTNFQNSEIVSASQLYKKKSPKYRIPQNTVLYSSKEISNHKNLIDAKEKGTEINKNVEYDVIRTVPDIPKTYENLSSLPKEPQKIPTTTKLITNIQNWLSPSNSLTSMTKTPKFRRPKGSPITLSNEIKDTNLFVSENENSERNNHVDNNTNRNVINIPKLRRPASLLPNVANLSRIVQNLIKPTRKNKYSPVATSSIIFTARVPKFRGPINGISKEVSYDNDTIETEVENAEVNSNIENGPNSASNVIKERENMPTLPNLHILSPDSLSAQNSKIIQNSLNTPPAQQSIKQFPKLKRPLSKTMSNSKEMKYDTEINHSEEENYEMKHNIQTDYERINSKNRNTEGNLKSKSPNIPTTTVHSSRDATSSEPSNTKDTKIKRPKSEAILTSIAPLHESDDTDSEHEISKINNKNNIEINKSIPSIPNEPNDSSNTESFPKPKTVENAVNVLFSQSTKTQVPKLKRPKDKTVLTSTGVVYSDNLGTKDYHSEIENSGYVFKIPKGIKHLSPLSKIPTESPKSEPIIQNSENALPSQSSKKKAPKFKRPKGKTSTIWKEVSYDADIINSEKENSEINHNINDGGMVFNVPKTAENPSSLPQITNQITENLNVQQYPTAIQKSPTTQFLQSSNKTVSKFKRPKNKTVTNEIEINDFGIINSEKKSTAILSETLTPFSGPSLTQVTPAEEPRRPITDNAIDNEGIHSERYNLQEYEDPTKYLKQSKETKSSKTPFSISSQGSPNKIPKYKRPKTKTFPEFTAKPIDTEKGNAKINNLLYNVNNNKDDFKLLNYLQNKPTVLENLTDVSGSLERSPNELANPSLGTSPNELEGGPSIPSPIWSQNTQEQILKHKESDNNNTPLLSIIDSKEKNRLDSEEDYIETKNRNRMNTGSESNFRVPQIIQNIPNISNQIKEVGSILTTSRFPDTTKNKSDNDLPQLSNFHKPHNKNVTISTDSEMSSPESNDNSKSLSYKPEERINQLSVLNEPAAAENLPDISSPNPFENKPIFTTSPISPIRVHKLNPSTISSVESKETDKLDSEEENALKNNQNVTDNNSRNSFQVSNEINNVPTIPLKQKITGDLQNILSSGGRSEIEPANSSSRPSKSKKLKAQKPKSRASTSSDSIRYYPEVGDSTFINPISFKNRPYFPGSQTSSTWIPERKRPSSKTVSPASSIYPIFNDNKGQINNLPDLVDNYSPENTFLSHSLVRYPKLKRPKSKVFSSFTDGNNHDYHLQGDSFHHEGTVSYQPQVGGNSQHVLNEAGAVDQAETKSSFKFENRPFYSNKLQARIPVVVGPTPDRSSLKSFSYNNYNMGYAPEYHDSAKKLFHQINVDGNSPFSPITSAIPDRLPDKTFSPTELRRVDTSESNPENENSGQSRNKETDDNDLKFLKSKGNLVYSSQKTGNRTYVPKSSKVSKDQHGVSETEESTPKILGDLQFPQYPKNHYDDVLSSGRHTSEIDNDADNLQNSSKYVKNLPLVPKVPKLAGNIQHASITPNLIENWPYSAYQQKQILPNRMPGNLEVLTPSTKVYYSSRPNPYLYNTKNVFRVSKSSLIRSDVHNVPKLPLAVYGHSFLTPSLKRVVKVPKRNPIYNGVVPLLNEVPKRRVVSNSILYSTNLSPTIIGHVQPVPEVPTPVYIPHTVHVPMAVGGLSPAPKVSLVGKSRRKMPLIIENHPHMVIASPVYTPMTFPMVKNTNNRIVPLIREISHSPDIIDSKFYKTFPRNVSPATKISTVRKPQLLSIPSPSMTNSPKTWKGLSKNRFLSSTEKHEGINNIGTFETGSTNTVHLQMSEHETLDMVALEENADRRIWGIPISNAGGKIEYLTVGNQEGNINFITTTDRLGRVEYLYRIRDDTGHYHNLHLKTSEGHLSLVESDYQGGQHSTGFIGYDETGEYIIPVHFAGNNRLVIDPYAHSLHYALSVHPAYEIVREVFYYKK